MALTDQERDDLRDTARSLLSRESSSERVRAAIGAAPGFDRALWDQMIELGWTSVHVPERLDGGGAGYADLAVLLHELGRAITPSPFLASAVLATGALLLADNQALADEVLRALVWGEKIGTVALASADGSYEPARATVTWERAAGGVQLHGASGFVLDAGVADVVVVAARGADGLPLLAALELTADGVTVEDTPTVDATRRAARVTFDGVTVADDRLLCEPGARAAEVAGQIVALGAVAAGCDAAGVTEEMLERSTAYAKERIQFGKPIGSFQAVKHHCANMAIVVEVSRAAARAGASALDAGDAAAWTRNADVVSTFVGPRCRRACELAMRVHGGIGFTWEHDAHLYLKRTTLDEMLFGAPTWHRRRIADDLIRELGVEVEVEVEAS
jgi:alkylation response protein AidB-like acyl-CoA dehydrogenase